MLLVSFLLLFIPNMKAIGQFMVFQVLINVVLEPSETENGLYSEAEKTFLFLMKYVQMHFEFVHAR